jgi:SAM-dependent methyltransferase
MNPASRLEASVRSAYEDPLQVDAFSAIANEGLTPFEAALVRQAFVSGQRVVDVGCGGGREAVPMAKTGLRLVAMDVSLAMVRAATAYASTLNVPLSPVVGSATALPFRPAVFDGVAMLGQVLAHIPGRGHRVDALRAAWAALRPGGTLVLTTHNRRCHWKFTLYFAWVNRWRRVRRWLGCHSELGDYDRWSTRISAAKSRRSVYFHMYDLDEAIADLHQAGFDVLDGRARAEFETGCEDGALQRRDYLLGFVARRPLEPRP